MVWIFSLLVVLGVSALSLLGLFFFSLKRDFLQKLLSFLVALAAGSLLGDVFLHLFPHAVETAGHWSGLATLAGFLLFFTLEKGLLWHHCHNLDCSEHQKRLGTMSLLADGLHNLIDGMVIAGSFLTSPAVGWATSLAVVLHEIPQEIGDFAILLKSGFSRRQALLFNFSSALTAFLGVGLVFLFRSWQGFLPFLISLTAGGFVYVAASGLIPQLHEEEKFRPILGQFFGLVLGMFLMVLLSLAE